MATSALAQTNDQEMVKVWSIDFSGRPPFSRQLIELPVADVARLETSGEIIETERVWTVKKSGKPPFRRRFEDIPVIDAASLEVNEADSSTRKKPLGSFKRHR
jgi:hypothetical protein